MAKANETRREGKEKTMGQAKDTGLRVATQSETRVLGRTADRAWMITSRGGYQTVRSFLVSGRDDEVQMMTVLGAFADAFADIRVAFQTISKPDRASTKHAVVLAAPRKVDEVRRILAAFWLGYNYGQDGRQ